MRILCAECDPDVAVGLDLILRDTGHDVVHTRSGLTALSCATSGTYDAMVTGIRLQDLNGCELIKMVRVHHPGLPVVILTGHAGVDTDGLTDGPLAILRKPSTIQAILAALDRITAA